LKLLTKNLFLIRHAKSSWEYPELRDHDRPLNKRGKRDAPLMAKVLKKEKIKPDLILSSSAVRAFEFAKVIADELGYKKNKIEVREELYMASENDLLKTVKSISDSCEIVFLVGHNPEITNFANSLSDYKTENIPTSGIFIIGFEIEKWSEVDFGKGKFIAFEYPKKYYN
jgi:phosphohistidine phosphatase